MMFQLLYLGNWENITRSERIDDITEDETRIFLEWNIDEDLPTTFSCKITIFSHSYVENAISSFERNLEVLLNEN